MNCVLELEKVMGVSLPDTALLEQALVHVSYLNENPDFQPGDNERLEFLGDAVLGLVAADFVYTNYPAFSEGELTSLRAALVRKETLAAWAAGLDLGQYLVMGRGEVASGGRARPSALAGAFEAIVGAVYLSIGMDAVRTFILRFLAPEAKRVVDGGMQKDYKSFLQETVQRRQKLTPRYRTVTAAGTDNSRGFTVEVLVGDEAIGMGSGVTKQAAQQQAARKALESIAGSDSGDGH